MVKVTGHLAESYSIARSVRQLLPLQLLHYVLVLERKLEVLRDIPCELECRGFVSLYADSVISEIEIVDTALREYEATTGAMVKQEKTVDLQFATWRGRSMAIDRAVVCWTDGFDKLHGV